MSLLDRIAIRPMVPADLPFVMSSWLKSNRSRCEWAPKTEYFALHHDVVEGLLARATTLVAVAKDDPDTIVGFVCAETAGDAYIVHYVYVKRAFRGARVAMSLFWEATGRNTTSVVATHRPAPDLEEKLRGWGWKVRPTLAFYLGLAKGAT